MLLSTFKMHVFNFIFKFLSVDINFKPYLKNFSQNGGIES